jgi:hypothetical protein
MVARERNNPSRPTVPTASSEEAGVAATDDGGQESAAERVDTRPEEVPAGRNRKGRRVVGFGVFDPASTDWGFR